MPQAIFLLERAMADDGGDGTGDGATDRAAARGAEDGSPGRSPSQAAELTDLAESEEQIDALLERLALLKGEDPPSFGAAETAGGNGPNASGGPADGPRALASGGAVLETLAVDPFNVRLQQDIDLGGEVPLETYVMRYTSAGAAQQRTASGAWIAWDGQEGSLRDNGLTPVNGKLAFDIVQGDLSNEIFPLSYSVAYRSDSGVKFGVFQVMPRAAAFE